MNRSAGPLLIVAAIFLGFSIVSLGGQQAQPAAGGVFTTAQAQAGLGAYAQQCAGCHGQDFRGSADAPSLQGEDFRAKWGPRAVNELFTTLVQTMPPTNPGALGEEGTLAVTALLLQINGARPGPAGADGTRRNAYQHAAGRACSGAGARSRWPRRRAWRRRGGPAGRRRRNGGARWPWR